MYKTRGTVNSAIVEASGDFADYQYIETLLDKLK